MSPYDDGWLLDTFDCLSLELKLNDPRTVSERELLVRSGGGLGEQVFDLLEEHRVVELPMPPLALGERDQGDERRAVAGDERL